MTTTVSITSQWQIYLPQKIRQAMGLKYPTQAKLTVKNKKLTVTPTTSPYLKLVGKYTHIKPVRPINLDRIRDDVNYTEI